MHTQSANNPTLIAHAGATQGQGNLTMLASLRVFGAASIVWFHIAPDGPGNWVGGIGLAVFLSLSFMQLARRPGIQITIKRRFRQLLVPWAGWWLIYAALSFWMARGVPPALHPGTSMSQILAWPAIHLWYLPFVFLASVGVLMLQRIAPPVQLQSRIALALAACIGLMMLVTGLPPLPAPAAQFMVASPSVPLGLAYGYCMNIADQEQRLRWLIAIAITIALSCVPVWLAGDYMLAIACAGGSMMMVLCVVPLPRSQLVRHLGVLTVGIYLAHPLAMLALWKFLGTGHPRWFMALATFILSVLIALVMRRIRFVRALV